MPCQYLNFIGGQWVPSRTQRTFPNINPANTGEVVGEFQASGPEDVAAAFAAAESAQSARGALPASTHPKVVAFVTTGRARTKT